MLAPLLHVFAAVPMVTGNSSVNNIGLVVFLILVLLLIVGGVVFFIVRRR